MRIEGEFLEAENGKKAFQLLEANTISIVFLDWNMPEMDGMDFLKKARGISHYKTLPIVMVTSEAARYNVVEALRMGATDYIIKPINEKVFLEKLSHITF